MVEFETISLALSFLQTVSLIVGVIYYLTIMRNSQRTRELTLKAQEHAVETRQAQLFMQLYKRWQEMDLEKMRSMSRTKLSGYEEFKERRDKDPQFRKAVNELRDFYEGLGVIVKEGYLSIRLVALMWAGTTRTFWENIVEPIIEDFQEQSGYPRAWSETVYLCRELVKYMEEHPELKT